MEIIMEILIGIIVLVFVTIYLLDTVGKEPRRVEDRIDPVIPAETGFVDIDELVKESRELGLALEAYERNKTCIRLLRQAFPHEDVQRELDFIHESNESIKAQSVAGVPAIVMKQEFIMLFDNMFLRLKLTREQFKLITGY